MAGLSIEKNLEAIRQRICAAAEKVGRSRNEIELIAVSKTKKVSQIQEAYLSGQICFGENYAQELKEKAQQLSNTKIEWHFIGPLQSNKVGAVVGAAKVIHSVDRESLVLEIQRVAEKKKLIQDVLMQINVANESSKSGVSIVEVEPLVEKVLQCRNISLVGLMTMPPIGSQGMDSSRVHFQNLKKIFLGLKNSFGKELGESFVHLSMGTTQDFEVAIEEGATYIRVGTEIFGARETKG